MDFDTPKSLERNNVAAILMIVLTRAHNSSWISNDCDGILDYALRLRISAYSSYPIDAPSVDAVNMFSLVLVNCRPYCLRDQNDGDQKSQYGDQIIET